MLEALLGDNVPISIVQWCRHSPFPQSSPGFCPVRPSAQFCTERFNKILSNATARRRPGSRAGIKRSGLGTRVLASLIFLLLAAKAVNGQHGRARPYFARRERAFDDNSKRRLASLRGGDGEPTDLSRLQ
jgi:hypothetical protein